MKLAKLILKILDCQKVNKYQRRSRFLFLNQELSFIITRLIAAPNDQLKLYLC